MATTSDIGTEPTFAARLGLLFRLAWPTMMSRAGIMVMALVDIVMVGRHSTQELAYVSLGMSLFIPILVTCIGLMLGVAILTSQHFGAGRYQECGKVWRRGLPWALTVGLVGTVFCALGGVWLSALGHSPDMARGGGEVALAFAPAVLGQVLFVVCAFHLEATRRPTPGMIAMLAANVVNVGLNWVFIYGNLGAPELGAVGSALTTSFVRVFLVAALFLYIVTRRDRAVYGIHLRPGRFWGEGGWRAGARLRRLGYAAGASYGIESFAYAMVLQYAGWLGAQSIAAYSIAHNMEATFFMTALGLGSATAVLVGNAVGAQDYRGAAAAGRLGVFAVIALMTTLCAIVWVSAPQIAAVYTRDPVLQELVAPVLLIAGIAAIFDGAQLVASQSSRAMGDEWGTTARHAIAFIGVMTPLAYLLGVEFGWGGVGLMSAVGIGSAVSLALHWTRFQTLCAAQRPPGPPASSQLRDPS